MTIGTLVVARDAPDQILKNLFIARLLALAQCSGHIAPIVGDATPYRIKMADMCNVANVRVRKGLGCDRIDSEGERMGDGLRGGRYGLERGNSHSSSELQWG